MKTKYIVIDTDGLEMIVIFEGFIRHDDAYWNNCDIVSAGFVDCKTGECYGKSQALSLPSRPEEDSKLARRMLRAEY